MVHHPDPIGVLEAEKLHAQILEAKRMTFEKLLSSFSMDSLKRFWNDLFESDMAKATGMVPLMSSLVPALGIYVLYVLFLTVSKAPKAMKTRRGGNLS